MRDARTNFATVLQLAYEPIDWRVVDKLFQSLNTYICTSESRAIYSNMHFVLKIRTRKKKRWFTYNPLRREMCKLLTVQMHAYSLRFFYPSSNIRRYYYTVDSVCWDIWWLWWCVCLANSRSQLSNIHTLEVGSRHTMYQFHEMCDVCYWYCDPIMLSGVVRKWEMKGQQRQLVGVLSLQLTSVV